jgi:hypothetical protein
MGGQRLAFTDYLLAQLDRREVDAIAAHELGHLRHKHPQKLTFGMVAVLVPAMSIGSQYLGAWGLAVASVVAALAFSALSRRFERQADAAAMELTGDPEAVISGLARLAQLNHLPLEWNKWDGSILTHPSTLARIRFVARRAGIDEARIRTLIESGLGERELYEIPSGVSAERVYSAGFRARHLAKMGWLLFAMQTATPALIFAAAHTFGSPIPRLVLDVIALGVTFAAVWVWFMNTGGGPYREVDVALRARFAKEGLALADLNARLVGFAPTTEPRFYDGTREWDAGYLIVEPDALVFIGEETRFRLPRAAVRGVHEITDRSHWRTMPWMAVTWSDAQGVDRTFMMRALVPTARRAIAATLGALNEVRAWHEGGALREAMQTACAEQLERMLLPLPPTSPVSSRAMHEIATPRSVVPTAICAALLAFGWSVLLGLGFGLSAAGGFDVFCVAMCSWALHVIPHWRIAARTRAAERARMATEASADKRAAA